MVEELVLDLLSNDEDDPAESGVACLASRVIHERLTARPNRSKLFQASEPTTVTGRKQYELHDRSLRPLII